MGAEAHMRQICADLAWVKALVGAVAALTAVALTLTVDVQPAGSPGRVLQRHTHVSAALLPTTPAESEPAGAAPQQPDVVDKHAEQRVDAAPANQAKSANPANSATQPPQPVPIGVALDPALTKPQPGDTKATLRARAALGKVDGA